MSGMRRREFIALLGGAVCAWPLAARAQQPGLPVIGYLSDYVSAESARPVVAAFRQGLSESGYIEGRNVAIEYRWAQGQYERLPALAADLVRQQVAIIVASGTVPSVLAAKGATAAIPIVFMSGSDPVQFGLVSSMNRPEGNLTGVTLLVTAQLTAKRLEVFHGLVPSVGAIVFLVNPSNPNTEPQVQELQRATRALGLQLDVMRAGAETEFESAFAAARQRSRALIVSADSFLTASRARLVALAARYAVPTMYQWREFATIGGLITYGPNLADAYRQVGIYAGRILKGAKPAELPVLQPTKYELVINLKTAKTLGLTVPDKLLALADEVVE
jgi:putative tryptophan/tyrosine transport system substrate-binding protein